MPIVLLSTTPSLSAITTAVLNSVAAGKGLIECFSGAKSYFFDDVYVGSKDRQSNFAKYGEPTSSFSTDEYEWDYDETNTQVITVYCNHSHWYFSSECTTTGFSVLVYDSTNTTLIDTGVYTSGMKIRVKPNANNTGTSNKHCYLYLATYNDVIIAGGTFAGTQIYEGANTPPVVDIWVSDSTFTLTYTDSVLAANSTSLWVSFTASGLPTSPDTVYYNVKRAGTIKASGSFTLVRNDINKQGYITLSEGAVAGATYVVALYTSDS